MGSEDGVRGRRIWQKVLSHTPDSSYDVTRFKGSVWVE
jgi:hypothetical protein